MSVDKNTPFLTGFLLVAAEKKAQQETKTTAVSEKQAHMAVRNERRVSWWKEAKLLAAELSGCSRSSSIFRPQITDWNHKIIGNTGAKYQETCN